MKEKKLPQLSQRAYNTLLKIYGYRRYQTAHEVEAAPMDRLEELLYKIAEDEPDYTQLLGFMLDRVCKPGALENRKEERVRRERREQKQREHRAT